MSVKIEINTYSPPEILEATADYLNELALILRKDKTEFDKEEEEETPDTEKVEVPKIKYPALAAELEKHDAQEDPNRIFGLPEPGEYNLGGQSVPIAPLELDAAGLPWDGRIHSRDKGKLKNGNWRIKKNIDRTQVAAIEAELRSTVPVDNDMPPMKVHHMKFNNLAASAPPPPPPPPPSVNDDPFDILMDIVENAINGGKITVKQVQDVVATVPGAINLSHLEKHPEFVPAVQNALAQALVGK